MVATAILSADPSVCRSLEGLLRDDAGIMFAGVAHQPLKLLGLTNRHRIDVVLVHEPLLKRFADSTFLHNTTVRMIAIMDRIDEHNTLVALGAGASAILSRSVTGKEVVSAINAVANGLAVFERSALARLGHADILPSVHTNSGNDPTLTPRELQVLTAMADGASNKAIARRLEISLHTVKFHVAAILEKLDADSRTEAVMKAAQRGLVML